LPQPSPVAHIAPEQLEEMKQSLGEVMKKTLNDAMVNAKATLLAFVENQISSASPPMKKTQDKKFVILQLGLFLKK